MRQARFLIPFLVELGLGYVDPFNENLARDLDPSIGFIPNGNIPKYVTPPMNQDITEWFAIGDAFSAGIGADVPSDSLNEGCSRFKMSYPNQMNEDTRFPGHSDSRTFVFASCSDADMQDVVNRQIGLLLPEMRSNFPAMRKPQIGTVSLSWSDLGFADIMNSCIYQWAGNGKGKGCAVSLAAINSTLNDPQKAFQQRILDSLEKILIKGRGVNPSFQLYVTGLNDVIREVVDNLEATVGGVYFVDEFDKNFDGHRFCEDESDSSYHEAPTDQRTWFIHPSSPYQDFSSTGGSTTGSFFDLVDSILIPPKDGKSTADQIKAAKGDPSALNPAYDSMDSMTESLNELAQKDPMYAALPVSWARIMHPKGAGYQAMSSAVIDKVLKFNTGPTDPGYAQGLHCTGSEVNKFLSRDELNRKIGIFCADAARQKEHDYNSGSISRTHNTDTRYEVRFGIDWPQGLDISDNMESNCINNMTAIMDSCGGNDPGNPLNWKRGGRFGAGWVNYDIVPTVDQGYTPGTCSFHLGEHEQWKGTDGPGTQRTYTYFLELGTMKDGAGKTIGTLGFAPNGRDPAFIEAGDDHSLFWDSNLPDQLVITPEAAGNPRDYMQFTIGSQSWRTSTDTGDARCDTGAWSSGSSPRNRTMDCFFLC
ncbi:hypothetical protein EKO27_g9124 [Xylaria grammica]|uniref:SGNH hydrolase-type esterase domain-containing protein n=1 Tax=Xylaria grammica TaxID=363999 RepID=A0A439CUW5_9PEZI|nr:hypothetical protein EKO27_g9124 [Xylaria grammica]